MTPRAEVDEARLVRMQLEAEPTKSFPQSNPFVIGRDGSRDEVIAKYRAWIVRQPELMAALPELRGKSLLCWCAPERCHADVLMELANR